VVGGDVMGIRPLDDSCVRLADAIAGRDPDGPDIGADRWSWLGVVVML